MKSWEALAEVCSPKASKLLLCLVNGHVEIGQHFSGAGLSSKAHTPPYVVLNQLHFSLLHTCGHLKKIDRFQCLSTGLPLMRTATPSTKAPFFPSAPAPLYSHGRAARSSALFPNAAASLRFGGCGLSVTRTHPSHRETVSRVTGW